MEAFLSATDDDTSIAWPSGFELLYTEQFLPMVRLARMLTGRQSAAEEIVQDAFLSLARHWHRIDRPPAYLRRIVVNATRSWHRKHFWVRPLTDADQIESPAPEIDETWDALAILSPRRRAAVVLRYWEDLSDAEIAQILSCKPATVRSLIHRALSQLEEILK